MPDMNSGEEAIFAQNLQMLRRYRLEPLLRYLDKKEKHDMQITQAQIDALTQDETDLTAAVSNAVQRSQTSQGLITQLQGEITSLQGQATADGTPIDTSKAEQVLKDLKAEVDGIAAPGVTVPQLLIEPRWN